MSTIRTTTVNLPEMYGQPAESYTLTPIGGAYEFTVTDGLTEIWCLVEKARVLKRRMWKVTMYGVPELFPGAGADGNFTSYHGTRAEAVRNAAHAARRNRDRRIVAAGGTPPQEGR